MSSVHVVLASINAAITQLLSHVNREHEPTHSALVNVLSEALATLRQTPSVTSAAPTARRGLAPWQLHAATACLREHRDRHTALQAAAQACHISRSHFCRSFKVTTGVTPTRWRLEQRCRDAQHMLRQPELALADIADACGFADQSHFTTVFSRLYRTSPGAWRRRALAGNESA